jgi:mannose-6-phosphate isomerase-like protein (cupin superfamily)
MMSFRDRKVEVHAGEMIVIPKGGEHKPSSDDGYKALLVEPEGLPNTGDVQSDMTIAKLESARERIPRSLLRRASMGLI